MNPKTDNPERLSVAEVCLDPRHAGGASLFTYLDPHECKPGDVVLAPLGGRTLLGVVASSGRMAADELLFPAEKLRPVSAPISGISLPPYGLRLAQLIAEEYACSLGAATSLFLLPGVQDRVQTQLTLTREPEEVDYLTSHQMEVVRLLREQGGTLVLSKQQRLPPALSRALRSLKERHIISESMSLQLTADRSGLPEQVMLSADSARIEGFLASYTRKRPAQALVLMRLKEAATTSFTMQELRALCGVSDATLKALITAGFLVPPPKVEAPRMVAPQANEEQQRAIDAIHESIRDRSGKTFLLYGVTGSGKTEVYLRCAEEALAQGRQVLYLVPEIALTAQVVGQLKARFGNSVGVLHSNLTPSDRQRTWLEIAEGRAPLVLGPRSALFAPLTNLGLIIVDEEHEGSYKQDATPRYSTKRLVKFLSEYTGAPAILGSATPSIETFYESIHGSIERLDLRSRATGAQLPEVSIVSLSELYRGGQPAILSPRLQIAIEERLARGEQTVLFLNRRAYAPLLSCRDCGHVMTCDDCSVALSVHKRSNSLICHYCDQRRPVPAVCPSCNQPKIRPIGMGTEKVEESVRLLFPNASVARLDRDTAQRKGAVEEIFTRMHAKDIDILVGTQMVAKGFDFPDVTLVGVVLADTALHLPDFRAAERTFQLLTQVSGRAGRSRRPGEVIIQAFDARHGVVTAASQHHYLEFYQQAIHEREHAFYPPFSRLVNIVFSGEDEGAVLRCAGQVAQALRLELEGYSVLGPSRSPIERVKKLWRKHVLVKLPPEESPDLVIRTVAMYGEMGVQITIDVDPQTML